MKSDLDQAEPALPQPQPQAMIGSVGLGLHWRSWPGLLLWMASSSTETSRAPGDAGPEPHQPRPLHFKLVAGFAAQVKIYGVILRIHKSDLLP
jgi:hypothetical protein